MPDTTSSLLQLLLQETGGNENNWGELLNDDITKIETAIASASSIVTTGGNVTLTDEQCRPPVIKVTGVLAANCALIVPARLKTWSVRNLTSGAFTLVIKTAAGASVGIPQGGACLVHCDGAGVVQLGQPTGPLILGADNNVFLSGLGGLFSNPPGAGNAYSRIGPGISSSSGYWENWTAGDVRVSYGDWWDGGTHQAYWGINNADVLYGANNATRLRLKAAGGIEAYGPSGIGGQLTLTSGGLKLDDGYGIYWTDTSITGTDAGPLFFTINTTVGASLAANGFAVGAPTGGYMGYGSINVQAAYVNGVAVLTSEAVKAAVSFSGASGNILGQRGNILSVVRNSTGFYTINFASALPDTLYSVHMSVQYSQDNAGGVAAVCCEVARITGAKTTTAVTIRTGFTTGVLTDPLEVYVAIIR